MTRKQKHHWFGRSRSGEPWNAGRLFWPICYAYFFGLIFWGAGFAKLGYPLPASLLSSAAHSRLQAKIYVTEIFLFITLVLCLSSFRWKDVVATAKRSRVFQIALFLLAAGLIRMALQLGRDPLLVIRNSAFSWYLLFPLLLSLIPLRLEDFEKLAKLITLVCLAFLLDIFSLVITFSKGGKWIAWLGMLAPLWLSLMAQQRWLRWIATALIGVSLGLDLSYKMQKTTWIGLFVFLAVVSALQLIPARQLLRHIVVLCIFALIPLGLCSGNQTKEFPAPWIKSEQNVYGMEALRWEMWLDAWNEVRMSPLLGVGFHDQVVKRIYIGADMFVPNTGRTQGPNEAPVSGPHNSYLNAAARMGIPAGILFLVLHILGFWALLKSRLYYCAWLLMGGVIYAFFNVGLEGPARSFVLLLCLGAAIHAEKAGKPLTKGKL